MKTESVTITDSDWRTRMLILVNVNLDGEVYPFTNAGIRVLSYAEGGPGSYIVECYVRRVDFPVIEDAFYYSIDRLNEFLGGISIITNVPIANKEILSICPMKVAAREEFDMLIPADFSYDVTPARVRPSDLEAFVKANENRFYKEAIRQVATALNSNSIEEKFLLYFSAFERVAEAESTEKLYSTCPECGHQTERGIATTNYIKNVMLSYGTSKKEFESIRSNRGKVAHGSGGRDNKFFQEVRKQLSEVESILLAELSKKLGLSIKMASKPDFEMPLWKIKGVKVSVAMGVRPSVFNIIEEPSFAVSVRFSRVKSETAEDPIGPEGITGTFGPEMSAKPKVHPECWPY